VFYWEIEIVSKGRDGYIAIGFMERSASLNRLPGMHGVFFILGWDNHSYGYHGNDGKWFHASSTIAVGYGPLFTTGDVIGCGINFSQNIGFYTKNGVFLGIAFNNLKAGSAFYPAVGLLSTSFVLTIAPGEIVEANFGATPFMFDIDQYFLLSLILINIDGIRHSTNSNTFYRSLLAWFLALYN
jgi:hypothetical protein